MDSPRKLKAGFLLFPGLTQLDFTGPYEVLAHLPELEIYTIAEEKGPVVSELGLVRMAEHDFSSTPQLDIICVPGGPGTLEAGARPGVIAFLQAQAPGAQMGDLGVHGVAVARGGRSAPRLSRHDHWLSLDLLPLSARSRSRRGSSRTATGSPAAVSAPASTSR